jgi:site-specific DNA-methyltransferase (adenine-specific)
MAEIVTIGDATLYLGDCMDILPTLDKVDAVITDPPYGNDDTHAKHLANVILKNGDHAGQSLGFDGISQEQMLEMAKQWVEKANRWVVFTSEWKFMSALDNSGLLIRFGIWRKPDGAPQFTGDRPGMGWEGIAICHRKGKKRWNGGGKHAFYTWAKSSNNSGHPTGKPIGLFSDFVQDFTDYRETILDPFMGSGTTGVAAIQMGRKFIGIEREPKYFDIACKRIEQATKQDDMFIPKMQQEQVLLIG